MSRPEDEDRQEAATSDAEQEPGLEPPHEANVNQVRHEPIPASHHDDGHHDDGHGHDRQAAAADRNEEAAARSATGKSPADDRTDRR